MNNLTKSSFQGQNETGTRIYELIERLYPICRSITGEGVRQTLAIMREKIPLQIHEVATGTQVFDWAVPNEWNITDAYIKNASGKRVVDFRHSNLHVVSYSIPVRQTMSLSDLKLHLHSLPDHPDWIPYRTSYYKEDWGFCITHRQFETMGKGPYEVVIDSSLKNGSLTYGEYFVPGDTTDEVLFFSHICHPSLCNDNLSGAALSTILAQFLTKQSLRYSYRFVFAPATIGSITWLSRNESNLSRVKHGLVLSVIGDRGKLHYKRSRRGTAEIDRAVVHVLERSGKDYEILDFVPYGYDERQFCSPGINLPMGRLTRTPNGCYNEYHTSADDLSFVEREALTDSFDTCLRVINLLEQNFAYLNMNPKCEPQLGRRGLYRSLGGHQHIPNQEYAMLWVLNMSDGRHSLLDIAEQSGLDFDLLAETSRQLQSAGLLQLVPEEVSGSIGDDRLS